MSHIADSIATDRPHTTSIPVGHGIDGAQLLVMSTCGRPAAVGELGEVIVRSRHLSDGYLDPGLTADRFAPLAGAGRGRVFRTGDLGRYDPRGAVVLAGRMDDQVKVRGFRVELGEVEAALRSHRDVVMAAAKVDESTNISVLRAFITTSNDKINQIDVLRHVRSKLPSYAVPSSLTVLAEMPMTWSGKVERAALPAGQSERELTKLADEMAETDLERLLVSIWCDVLGVPWVGSGENFFEIGGHSMAIVEVQSKLVRVLNQPVSVVDLFRFPTIKSLADHLSRGNTDTGLLDSFMRGRMRRLSMASRRHTKTHGGEIVDGR
jgi:AMP-binding enzyme/Phosphopantetheine attachment site/AMP-binding enzyme C-terminal domain